MRVFVVPVIGFNCFSEYQFSWCESADEKTCVHRYMISISRFQRRFRDYRLENRAPPLAESFFLTQLPKEYELELQNSGCSAPLVVAHFLVAETRSYYNLRLSLVSFETAKEFVKLLRDDEKSVLDQEEDPWLIEKARKRTEETILRNQDLLSTRKKLSHVAIVVAHCEENFDWIKRLFSILPDRKRESRTYLGISLYIYEKCGGQEKTLQLLDKISHQLMENRIHVELFVLPQIEGSKECSAYLSYLLRHLDFDLGDFVFFLHSDFETHVNFWYLQLVLGMIAQGSFDTNFLPLTFHRHLLSVTPCLKRVFYEIFGSPLKTLLGPYCCSQFVVSREAIVKSRHLFRKIYSLVDGSRGDLCSNSTKTHCYGLEFLWHVVFTGETETLAREDANLSLPLRQKYDDEIFRTSWKGVDLARSTSYRLAT